MPEFILTIEEDGQISELARHVVEGTSVRVRQVYDVVAAKRLLIQSAPAVMLCAGTLDDDSEAGFQFCEEVKGHPELARVPLILVADEMDDQSYGRALALGALTLLAWPLTPSDLKSSLIQIIPELAESSTGMAIEFDDDDEDDDEEEGEAVESASASTSPEAPRDEKLQLAQRLLAQVLHGLKTSDLLTVVDLEDVPRVVFEMARSVCGQQSESARKEPAEQSAETAIDLDSAFGLKK